METLQSSPETEVVVPQETSETLICPRSHRIARRAAWSIVAILCTFLVIGILLLRLSSS